jgi:hypothetical protein
VDLYPVLTVSTQSPTGGTTVAIKSTNAGPDTTYNIVVEPYGGYVPCTPTGESTCTADGLSDDFGSLIGAFQAQVITGPGSHSNSVTVAWSEPTLTVSNPNPSYGSSVDFNLTNGTASTIYTLTEEHSQTVEGSCTPNPGSTTCTVDDVDDNFDSDLGNSVFTGTGGSVSNPQPVQCQPPV